MSKRLLPLLAMASLAGCQSAPSPLSPTATRPDLYQTQLTPSIGHLKQPLDRHKLKWYTKHGFVLVPEVAAVTRLELKPALPPEAWDTATILVESPDTERRTLQLFQGSDLLPVGGSMVATGSLLSELDPGDYTWTVSLWKDGPTGTLVGEDRQAFQLVAGPNSLKLSPEAYPTLGLLDFDPGSTVPGATVSLLGQGFSVVPEQDVVTIGGRAVPVLAATSTRLTVVTPELAPGRYVVWVQVGSGMVGKTGFGITAP